jgi:cyclopropane fatty-acyl-phospholipid synthase-like methyltransferase
MPKPFSLACENNKGPILEVLREAFAGVREVLEIGAGTGQHAVHFAANLPHLSWQPSDRCENHPGIRAWAEEAGLANLRGPIALDVTAEDWNVGPVDGVFSANTAHIMHWFEVEAMFERLSGVLADDGVLVLYGPFHYGGRPTSPSNAAFDASLRARDPGMGVRDFEAVDALARAADLRLLDDRAMPANNRTLVWGQGRAGIGADPARW